MSGLFIAGDGGQLPWTDSDARPNRAVFLDRDGTLNEMVYDADHGTVDSPTHPEQLSLLPGAAEAVRRINELGLLAVVVSNQPIVAKGKASLGLLEQTTLRLRDVLAAAGAVLDGVYYCLHHPRARADAYRQACACRKPGAALLQQAAHAHGIDLARSYMVGDGLNDVAAGRAAGCRTVWIGNARWDWARVAVAEGVPDPDWIADDLREAVEVIAVAEERSRDDVGLRGFHGSRGDQAVGRVRSDRWRHNEPLDHARVRGA